MVFVFDVGRAVGSNPSKVERCQKDTKEYSCSHRNYNLLPLKFQQSKSPLNLISAIKSV